MTVKRQTGNLEVVTILNIFGHGLSYLQVEEFETALAEKEIDKGRDGALIQSVCRPDDRIMEFIISRNRIREELVLTAVLNTNKCV